MLSTVTEDDRSTLPCPDFFAWDGVFTNFFFFAQNVLARTVIFLISASQVASIVSVTTSVQLDQRFWITHEWDQAVETLKVWLIKSTTSFLPLNLFSWMNLVKSLLWNLSSVWDTWYLFTFLLFGSGGSHVYFFFLLAFYSSKVFYFLFTVWLLSLVKGLV
jgi:hypothetical protein